MQNIIGIRELSNQTSQIVRLVREKGAEYVITRRGKPVAILRPLTDEDVQQLRQEEFVQQHLLDFLDEIQEKIPNVPEAEVDEDVTNAIQAIRATE